MNPSGRPWHRFPALVFSMAIIAWPTMAADTGSSPLAIGGYSMAGDLLSVTVINTSDQTLTGTVFASVVVDGLTVTSQAAVTVPGEQKALVVLGLPPEAATPIILGVILDDGVPF